MSVSSFRTNTAPRTTSTSGRTSSLSASSRANPNVSSSGRTSSLSASSRANPSASSSGRSTLGSVTADAGRARTSSTSTRDGSKSAAGVDSIFDRQQAAAQNDVNRPGRGLLRNQLPKNLGDDFDDFFDDLAHDWDDHWHDWNGYYGFHNHFGGGWWWNHHHFHFGHLFPYHHHGFFLHRHPFFHYFPWYHYWFGYYPIYRHYYTPAFVSYSPVFVPTAAQTVYVPVYAETAAAPAATPDLNPALARELYALGNNRDAIVDLETGARLFKEGNYAAAADAFRTAEASEPMNAVPKFALAHALFALGDYEGAAFLVKRGMELLPEWPSVGTSLHELYGDPSHLQEHIIGLSTYSATNPAAVDARFLLGYVRYFTGDLDGAESAFRAVEAATPYRADVTSFLSRIAEIRLELLNHGG